MNFSRKHQKKKKGEDKLAFENAASISWIALNNASFKMSRWKESSRFSGTENLDLQQALKLAIRYQIKINNLAREQNHSMFMIGTSPGEKPACKQSQLL